jgi:hypothetical protein
MDPGAFDIRGEAQRLGERWLLVCDLVGGAVGAMIAIVVLVALIG